MKVYTKGGDKGETSLYGGKRVPKFDIRIEANGTVDELNAHIALISDFSVSAPHQEFLIQVQHILFDIGAIVAADPNKPKLKLPDLPASKIQHVEELIDALDEQLKPLNYFVLPGGHEQVSQIHIARTICRRAERRVVELNNQEALQHEVIIYLNRLSDFLFVYSRWVAKELGVEERYWVPEK